MTREWFLLQTDAEKNDNAYLICMGKTDVAKTRPFGVEKRGGITQFVLPFFMGEYHGRDEKDG